jgi:hypothetical protein
LELNYTQLFEPRNQPRVSPMTGWMAGANGFCFYAKGKRVAGRVRAHSTVQGKEREALLGLTGAVGLAMDNA